MINIIIALSRAMSLYLGKPIKSYMWTRLLASFTSPQARCGICHSNRFYQFSDSQHMVFTLSPRSFWSDLFQLLIWTILLLQMRVPIKNQKMNGKQRRSWWDGSLWAISSGSILFVKVTDMVCRAERDKDTWSIAKDKSKYFSYFSPKRYVVCTHEKHL